MSRLPDELEESINTSDKDVDIDCKFKNIKVSGIMKERRPPFLRTEIQRRRNNEYVSFTY